MKLATAVRRALKDHESESEYQGAEELALVYAKAIDDGADLDVYGPLLLDVFEALLLTPRARAVALKASKRDHAANPLDELRARRAAARESDAETMDTPAS